LRPISAATPQLDSAAQSLPPIAIIDSQSVKTGKMGGERGYDGGKQVKGRKRHLMVGSLDLPLGISVTATRSKSSTQTEAIAASRSLALWLDNSKLGS
jgi:hypothetical protein